MITSATLPAGILALVAMTGAIISLLAYSVQSWNRVLPTILAGLIGICICVTVRGLDVLHEHEMAQRTGQKTKRQKGENEMLTCCIIDAAYPINAMSPRKSLAAPKLTHVLK